MSSQPTSGYYQFVVAVTGDSRLVANHVEVREVRSWRVWWLGCLCLLIVSGLLGMRMRSLCMNIKTCKIFFLVSWYRPTPISFTDINQHQPISISLVEWCVTCCHALMRFDNIKHIEDKSSIVIHYFVILLRKSWLLDVGDFFFSLISQIFLFIFFTLDTNIFFILIFNVFIGWC